MKQTNQPIQEVNVNKTKMVPRKWARLYKHIDYSTG